MEIISIIHNEETGFKETVIKHMSRASMKTNACELVTIKFDTLQVKFKKVPQNRVGCHLGILSTESFGKKKNKHLYVFLSHIYIREAN